MGARPPERSPAPSGSSGRALHTDGTEDYVYTPSGTPIEQMASSATSTLSVTYLLQDGTGSTRLLTDSTGSVVATYAYDAYGNLTTASGTATTPLLFQGQYDAQALGADDLRARWYDPGSGQFLSVDPLVAATETPFGDAGGDPVNFSDPTGLCSLFGNCWSQVVNAVGGFVVADAATLSTVASGLATISYLACAATEGIGCGLGLALSAASTALSGINTYHACIGLGWDCTSAEISFGVSLAATGMASYLQAAAADARSGMRNGYAQDIFLARQRGVISGAANGLSALYGLVDAAAGAFFSSRTPAHECLKT